MRSIIDGPLGLRAYAAQHGHMIRVGDEWAHCAKCGRFTAVRAAGRRGRFGVHCRGKPANRTAAKRLEWLQAGMSPYGQQLSGREAVSACDAPPSGGLPI